MKQIIARCLLLFLVFSFYLLLYSTYCLAELKIVSRGPYLGPLSDKSVWISWITNFAPKSNKVEYGREAQSRSIAVTRSKTNAIYEGLYRIDVQLTGLKADTRYYYKVMSDNLSSERCTFKTFPRKDAKKIRFAVYGDSRWDAAERAGRWFPHKAVANAIAVNEDVSLVLHTGDLIDVGNAVPSRWPDQWFDSVERLASSAWLATTVGNHDIYSNTKPYPYPYGVPGKYLDNFKFLPVKNPNHCGYYYSFDYGSVHFVSLTNNQEIKGADRSINPYYVGKGPIKAADYLPDQTEQMRWFVKDVKAALKAKQKWVVAFGHNPIYSSGSNNHSEVELRDSTQLTGFREAVEEVNTDIFFSGHSHGYLRFLPSKNGSLNVNGTRYYVTGGATSAVKDIKLKGDAVVTEVYTGSYKAGIKHEQPADWVPWAGGESNSHHRAAIGLNYYAEFACHYLLVEIEGDTCKTTVKYIDPKTGKVGVYDVAEWKKLRLPD